MEARTLGMKTILTVPPALDSRKKHWRKLVTGVDTSQASGYAFVGPWLRAGERAELPLGSYVLGYDEPGSVKNWYPRVTLWRVADSELEEVYRYEGRVGERDWALACRDEIARILAGAANPEERRAALMAEAEQLRRRLAEIEDELARLEG